VNCGGKLKTEIIAENINLIEKKEIE